MNRGDNFNFMSPPSGGRHMQGSHSEQPRTYREAEPTQPVTRPARQPVSEPTPARQQPARQPAREPVRDNYRREQEPPMRESRDVEIRMKKRPVFWPMFMAFISAVLLVVTAISLVMATTMVKPEYMKSVVDNSDFAVLAYSELETEYRSYAGGSNLDPQLLMDSISVDGIKQDMKNRVDDFFEGDTSDYEYAELRDKIYESLLAEAQSRGLALDEDLQSGLYEVAAYCRRDYAGYVAIPLAGVLYSFINGVDRVIWIIFGVSAAFTLLSLFLTFKLSGGARYGFRSIAFSLIAAAGLCLIVAFVLYPVLGIANLHLAPESIKVFMTEFIHGVFSRHWIFGAAYGVLAIPCMIPSIVNRGRRR